ncbi:hypothetical protein Ccrd_026047, partial [Cynara cardunculus var. scolymus]
YTHRYGALDEIEEFGEVKDISFVWIKQKKEKAHNFEHIDQLVSYDTEIERLIGVDINESSIWITLNEIIIDDPLARIITFRNPSASTNLFQH